MSTDQTSRSLAGLSADLGRSLGLSNGGRLAGPRPLLPGEALPPAPVAQDGPAPELPVWGSVWASEALQALASLDG